MVFESILMNSEDDAMEEDVVVTTPVTPGVSLHYPQVFATKGEFKNTDELWFVSISEQSTSEN